MRKKKRREVDNRLIAKGSSRTSVQVGNISATSGTVNVAGGNITTHNTATGLSGAEIKQLFDVLYSSIEARADTTPVDKEDIKAEVKDIQVKVTEAVQKNDKLDEGFLARRFRNIARMAPDILDVVVATLGKPLAGLGAAVKMTAEKAKEETKN